MNKERYITGYEENRKKLKGVIDFDEFELEKNSDLEIETGDYDNIGQLKMGKKLDVPKELIKNTNLLNKMYYNEFDHI